MQSLYNLRKTSVPVRKSQCKITHSTWHIILVISATNSHLSESQAAGVNPLYTNLRSKRCQLTKRVSAPKKQGGGSVKRLLSWCCAVISLVVESVCPSGSLCFLGHWTQSIYTEKGFSIYLMWTALPSLMSSLNDGCHVLRRLLTSGLQSFLPSLSLLSPSGSICAYKAAARGSLSK